jgi:hypothetical protein
LTILDVFRGIETMPKRQSKPRNPIPGSKPSIPTDELRATLFRRKKAELVDILMELAQADRKVRRQLVTRFHVETSPDEIMAAMLQAIADATAFDKRDINRNFAYDFEAYAEVQRNLGRLINSGQPRLAMKVGLELMKQGSYQVEMSDEGLMTEDIEACLNVVIKALGKCDLPAAEAIAWCSAMLETDRTGFIASEALESLRNRIQTTAEK